jgi:hypothetical protein
VHDDLKSARSRKLVRKGEDKSFSHFNGQESVAEIQIEVNSRMKWFAADKQPDEEKYYSLMAYGTGACS